MAASTPGRHTATVLLVDDHPLMRKGLRTLLQSDADLTVVGEASDAREALEQVRALSPDVVVMGLTMPNMNGIDATRRILAEAPETRVVALSIHAEKRFVDDMLKAGASACVLKDSAAEELVRAIHAVLRGEAFLSGPILATVVSGYRKSMDDPALAVEEDTVVSAEPILQTKLHHPASPVDLVPRTHLLTAETNIGFGSPNITADWEADSDNRWTVPVGLGFNTMTKIGKLPVKWGLELHYFVEKPDAFGPEWNLRFVFSPVVPKPAFSKAPIFGN